MLINEDIHFFRYFKHGNVQNRILLNDFNVTKERCCYGYPLTKGNKIANEYFWECHDFCFSENRNGISQTYTKL